MPTHNVSTLSPRSYVSAIENGRYSRTIAPRTLWRQAIRAADTQSEASTITIVGNVEAIHDGQYGFFFYDPAGADLGIHPTVVVAMPEPADETELAAAIALAFLEYPGLEDYLASATSDGPTFEITLNPGMPLRIGLEDLAVVDVTVEHFATIDLNALRPTNAFPRNMLREHDSYVQVVEAFPADSVLDVAGESGTVLDAVPLDAEGEHDGTTSAFSRGDNIETAWQPVATLSLGADPFPAAGLVEVRVPFSPILTPVRLE